MNEEKCYQMIDYDSNKYKSLSQRCCMEEEVKLADTEYCGAPGGGLAI